MTSNLDIRFPCATLKYGLPLYRYTGFSRPVPTLSVEVAGQRFRAAFDPILSRVWVGTQVGRLLTFDFGARGTTVYKRFPAREKPVSLSVLGFPDEFTVTVVETDLIHPGAIILGAEVAAQFLCAFTPAPVNNESAGPSFHFGGALHDQFAVRSHCSYPRP